MLAAHLDTPDERARLAAVYALDMLDTPREERFERITRLVQAFFGVPIVFISLVEADRQWFKSCIGLDIEQTGREVSFCAHTIRQAAGIQVPDTHLDDRFLANPLVVAEPFIRSYHGVPLIVDGHRVGALALVGHEPRTYTDQELAVLRSFADLVERELSMTALEFALAQVRASEERYHDLFDNALDLIQCITPDGRFLYTNPAWRETLGYTEAEVAAISLWDVLARDEHAHCQDVFARMLAGEDVTDVETVFVSKAGVRVPVEGNISCRIEGGQPVSTRGIFRDISARKAGEQLKDQFLGIVSHDLMNPLSSMKLGLEYLVDDLGAELPADAIKVLGQTRAAVERLIRLTNQLLDNERLLSGQLQLRRTRVDLAELLAAAVADSRGRATSARVALEACASPCVVDADGDRLMQVLINLIGNAIKFSPAGARVEASAVRAGDQVVVRVRDEGRGIPADKLGKIFERFGQAQSSDHLILGGAGLGLTIARSIVEAHGGRLEVESQVGHGSTFTFSLPLAEATVA